MIYLGSDHGGFDLKEKIKKWLTLWEYAWEDLGNTYYDNEDDYPQFAFQVAQKVVEEEKSGKAYPIAWKDRPKGILCCRSATGMIIAANKVKGAKVTTAFEPSYAKKSRLHNDTNIIAVGADWLEDYRVKKVLKTWLETEFSGEERHVRRLKMIEDYENG